MQINDKWQTLTEKTAKFVKSEAGSNSLLNNLHDKTKQILCKTTEVKDPLAKTEPDLPDAKTKNCLDVAAAATEAQESVISSKLKYVSPLDFKSNHK